MAKNKIVEHNICECGKRGFANRHMAEKAMGRAQTKRVRAVSNHGTRRGLKLENRIYTCPESGLFHLTEQSRRHYESYATAVFAL